MEGFGWVGLGGSENEMVKGCGWRAEEGGG